MGIRSFFKHAEKTKTTTETNHTTYCPNSSKLDKAQKVFVASLAFFDAKRCLSRWFQERKNT
jgi:hypothetical protein